uniref:Uncharacterized protein n=1 Tax=Trieres chinensis TaxID=1514140 RepID=A0A7S2A656_TRICV|mmetsp:Transcript_39978/g.81652  ORF Transcript_39978/g.81652 Transcript_39978/m.81652 type:complete len:241 (+) Transcript_39978:3-725(+)
MSRLKWLGCARTSIDRSAPISITLQRLRKVSDSNHAVKTKSTLTMSACCLTSYPDIFLPVLSDEVIFSSPNGQRLSLKPRMKPLNENTWIVSKEPVRAKENQVRQPSFATELGNFSEDLYLSPLPSVDGPEKISPPPLPGCPKAGNMGCIDCPEFLPANFDQIEKKGHQSRNDELDPKTPTLEPKTSKAHVSKTSRVMNTAIKNVDLTLKLSIPFLVSKESVKCTKFQLTARRGMIAICA